MRILFPTCVLSLALPAALAAQGTERDPVIETARALAQTAVERVAEQSRSPQALEGVWAAEQSGAAQLRAFGPAAVSLLEAVMSEPDSSHVTRTASAFALATLAPSRADAATDVLMEQLHSTGFSSEPVVPSLLVALGSVAVPGLVPHVEDPAVVDVLRAMGADARAAVPALIQQAAAGNLQAAAALVEVGAPEGIAAARPVLLGALGDEDWQTVRAALQALGELRGGGRDLVPRIGDFLDHPVAEVRLAAAVALADIGAANLAVPALERLVADTTVYRRFTALQKLAQMGPRARPAADGLLRVVQDARRVPGERAAAVAALGRIHPAGPQYRAAWQAVAASPELRALAEAAGARAPGT